MLLSGLLFFVFPILGAAALISPIPLGEVLEQFLICFGVALVALPVLWWPLLMIMSSISAMLELWLSGAALVGAIFIFLTSAMMSGAPVSGVDPVFGYLLAGLPISMLVSFGFWGIPARVLPRPFWLKVALVSGLALYMLAIAFFWFVSYTS